MTGQLPHTSRRILPTVFCKVDGQWEWAMGSAYLGNRPINGFPCCPAHLNHCQSGFALMPLRNPWVHLDFPYFRECWKGALGYLPPPSTTILPTICVWLWRGDGWLLLWVWEADWGAVLHYLLVSLTMSDISSSMPFYFFRQQGSVVCVRRRGHFGSSGGSAQPHF